MNHLENKLVRVTAGSVGFLLVENLYDGWQYILTPPGFEIEGVYYSGEDLLFTGEDYNRELANGGREVGWRYRYNNKENMYLLVILQYYPDSPLIRYRYNLCATRPIFLSKKEGKDRIRYTGFSTDKKISTLIEIQFSHFNPMVHSYVPHLEYWHGADLPAEFSYPGPVTLVEFTGDWLLLAYEHGAEYPDSYLSFQVAKERQTLAVYLDAVKGNYYDGQVIGDNRPFQSVWFHFACCRGEKEEILKYYREFFLNTVG